MAKVSSKVKLDAVERCLIKNEPYGSVATSIGVNRTTVRDWCHLYKTEGEQILIKPSDKRYDLRTKIEAVKYYLDGKGSYRDTCEKFEIKYPSSLRNWIKLYNSRELKASPKGGKIMTKGRKTTFEERIEIVTECLKQNLNYKEIAEKYRVSYQQIYQWTRKYKENGASGLVDNRGCTKTFEKMSELEKIKAENKILKAQLERKELENIFLKKVDEIEGR